MNKLSIFIIAFFTTLSFQLSAQSTVGLLSFTDVDKVQEGYNLYFPHGQTDVFLLDNCGRIVHTWEGDTYKPGNSVFLTEEGLLYKCGGRGAGSNEWIHAGGGGEVLQIVNWDGSVALEYAVNDSMQRMHHDIAVKPNGNVLAIVWDRILEEDALQAGRNPNLMAQNEVWSEKIIEIEPNLENGTAEIVWEWRVWDHLVQDFDETKENFGVIANNQDKINLNYDTSDGHPDWLHINSIDYNPFYEQIMLSVPTFNEIWIIDQSTSTQQAAGSTGGLSGSGGDLLFRYGNPAAYDRGTAEDQVNFYQHDAHWMDLHLQNGDEGFGKVMLFNNQVEENKSTVDIVNVVFDDYESGFPMENGVFQPSQPASIFETEEPSQIHSTGLSGAQKLKNGNTLICVGRYGYMLEVTNEGEIVWEYKNPFQAGMPVSQGAELGMNDNLVFRFYRYPLDFAAFEGKDLTPKGYIELNPDEENCPLPSSNDDEVVIDLTPIHIYPNPANNLVNLYANNAEGEIKIFNLTGQLQLSQKIEKNELLKIDTNNWISGTYLIMLNNELIEKLVVVE